MTKTLTLDLLYEDALRHICTFLSYKTIIKLPKVSKKFDVVYKFITEINYKPLKQYKSHKTLYHRGELEKWKG